MNDLTGINIVLPLNLTKPISCFLYVKAKFTDSQVDYNEVDSFLSGLDLPKYPNLFAENINIEYSGEPLKFDVSGNVSVENGELTFSAFMDLYPELIEFDYNIEAKNVDLSSTLGITSNLNAKANLSGKGFDPEKSNSKTHFVVTNSIIEGHNIDTANVR